MQLIRDLSQIPESLKTSALALGNFDGLHRGHQAIVDETLARARADKIPAAVMSFYPHPREFFTPDAPPLTLMRLREKIAAFTRMGFDALFLPRFNQALASMGAEEFIETLLVKKLAVRHVVTGGDFRFGARRAGCSVMLAQKAKEHGFSYHAIAPVATEAGVISSSAIRAFLSEGNLAQANALLGHPYDICGHVAHGDKRGRMLGFPTANISMENFFMPKKGVYEVRVTGEGLDNARGVANIGARPTVGGTQNRLEAHLFDVNDDLYGRYLRVQPLRFIREEKKFASLDELKAQIEKDVAEAKT